MLLQRAAARGGLGPRLRPLAQALLGSSPLARATAGRGDRMAGGRQHAHLRVQVGKRLGQLQRTAPPAVAPAKQAALGGIAQLQRAEQVAACGGRARGKQRSG